jgi:hypothetical protein
VWKWWTSGRRSRLPKEIKPGQNLAGVPFVFLQKLLHKFFVRPVGWKMGTHLLPNEPDECCCIRFKSHHRVVREFHWVQRLVKGEDKSGPAE